MRTRLCLSLLCCTPHTGRAATQTFSLIAPSTSQTHLTSRCMLRCRGRPASLDKSPPHRVAHGAVATEVQELLLLDSVESVSEPSEVGAVRTAAAHQNHIESASQQVALATTDRNLASRPTAACARPALCRRADAVLRARAAQLTARPSSRWLARPPWAAARRLAAVRPHRSGATSTTSLTTMLLDGPRRRLGEAAARVAAAQRRAGAAGQLRLRLLAAARRHRPCGRARGGV